MTPSRLFNHIIRDCFDGSIQYVNTKRQFLINQGTLMSSPMFQQYLQNSVHKDLDINQWIHIEQQIQNRAAVGPAIMEKLRHNLHRISHTNSDETKSAINSNGTVSKQQTIKQQTPSYTTSVVTKLQNVQCDNNVNLKCNYNVPQNINVPFADNISCTHSPSQSSSISHSSPSIPIQLPQQVQVSNHHNNNSQIKIVPPDLRYNVSHQYQTGNNTNALNSIVIGAPGYGPIHGQSSIVSGKISFIFLIILA